MRLDKQLARGNIKLFSHFRTYSKKKFQCVFLNYFKTFRAENGRPFNFTIPNVYERKCEQKKSFQTRK